MKKILFTCILFLGLGLTTGFAQSDKMKEKATERIEKLNAEITAGDASQALTEEQKTKLMALEIEKLKEIRKNKKDGGDNESRKAINKKYAKQIYQDVLTKEQKKARKTEKTRKTGKKK